MLSTEQCSTVQYSIVRYGRVGRAKWYNRLDLLQRGYQESNSAQKCKVMKQNKLRNKNCKLSNAYHFKSYKCVIIMYVHRIFNGYEQRLFE